MKTRMICVAMIAFFALSVSTLAGAMTAERVIENMIASYERQMKGVEDFTVIMEGDVVGRSIIYHKRAVIRGKTIYKARNEMKVMGEKFIMIWDGAYLWLMDPVSREVRQEKMDINPYQMVENLKAAQVKYAGTDKIGGYKTHILSVKDLNKTIGAEGAQKVSGKLWVDAQDWVIRKMKMEMEIEAEKGEKISIKTTARMEDFRRVNGMLIAYRIVMTMPVPGALEMSPEEEEEMRQALAEMQKGLEEMPPAQREMIEAMMKPQIEMMEKMFAGGEIKTVTVVKDVQVNTGLSDELFDGSKLR